MTAPRPEPVEGRSPLTTLVLPAGTPSTLPPILEDIAAERIAQDAEWGGPPHDDAHTLDEWLDLIGEHLEIAEPDWRAGDLQRRISPLVLARYRRQLVIVAALAAAGLEAFDRAAVSIPPRPEEAAQAAVSKDPVVPPCDVE